MTKFKVSFVIDSEQLARMIAVTDFRFVGDLRIEEIAERPLPKAPPAVVALSERFKARKKFVRKAPSIPTRLDMGINRIIMQVLADGKLHRAAEVKPLLAQGGYSPNSAGSRMQALAQKGVIKQNGDGTWELAVPAPE